MEIPKAIEILKLAISDPDLVGAVNLMNAQKLAIDALTFLDECHTEGTLMKTFTPPKEDPIIDTHRSEHHIKHILESPPGRESGQ